MKQQCGAGRICVTEAAEMGDRAETRGPGTRRRRTTVSGAGGGPVKQANGSKWPDIPEKPPRCPTNKAKTEDDVTKHAGSNGKVESPKKQKSAAEDINDRLR